MHTNCGRRRVRLHGGEATHQQRRGTGVAEKLAPTRGFNGVIHGEP